MIRHIMLIAALGGVATAGTAKGTAAEHLTYALRYAGSAPVVKKTAHTYTLAAADCIATLDAGGKLSELACTVGKTELKDAAAYLLYSALVDAGASMVPIEGDKIQVSTKSVSCTFDRSAKDDSWFVCTGDSLSSKPADVKITPKKVPIKDIVQPVKIEKQK